MSYFGSVTLAIIIKCTWLNNRRSCNFMNIHIILVKQSLLSHHGFIRRAGMVENHPWYNLCSWPYPPSVCPWPCPLSVCPWPYPLLYVLDLIPFCMFLTPLMSLTLYSLCPWPCLPVFDLLDGSSGLFYITRSNNPLITAGPPISWTSMPVGIPLQFSVDVWCDRHVPLWPWWSSPVSNTNPTWQPLVWTSPPPTLFPGLSPPSLCPPGHCHWFCVNTSWIK